MPQSLFDDQRIDVPCPECGQEVTASIGKLKRSPTLQCRAGHTFDVDAKQLARDLAKVEQSLANFGKGLKF